MVRSVVLHVAAALALAASLSAQTADDIIAKNIQARGGLEKIKAVKSMKMIGRMTIGPGAEAPVVVEIKRPNKMRLDVTFQGMTLTQSYDGKKGWVINPFEGSKNAEPMSPEDLKESEEQADIDGPLVDWKAKGHSVELLGKEKVEGTDAYKLKLTMKTGTIRYVFIDADSYLDIRNEEKRTIRGTETETEQTIGDYKDVRGMLIPHAFESGAKGHPEKQKITIDMVQLDAPIADDRFDMPAPGKEAPAEKKK